MSGFRYIPLYRPPMSATLPHGWRLVEVPKFQGHTYFRPDLPQSTYYYGVVEFDYRLSPVVIKAFQLREV